MHGPNVSFYKYLSPTGALATLQNGHFKWSNPSNFNDPFDFPTDIDFDFSAEQFADALIEELLLITHGPDEPTGDASNEMFAMGLAARNHRPRAPIDEAIKYFNDHIRDELYKSFTATIYKRREAFRYFRNEYSVFCLSTTHTNLLMWAHYCHDHKGCVLELQCIPEIDNPIRAAEEVEYVDSYPVFATIDELVKQATGQKDLDYDNLLKLFFYSKSSHWSYEEEWRCVCPIQNKEAGYDLVNWSPQEITNIYIGCNATEEFRQQVLNLVDEKLPNTNVFQSRPQIQNFALLFDQVK